MPPIFKFWTTPLMFTSLRFSIKRHCFPEIPPQSWLLLGSKIELLSKAYLTRNCFQICTLLFSSISDSVFF